MSLPLTFKDHLTFPYITSETTNIPGENYYGDWAQLVNEEITAIGSHNKMKISYVGTKDDVVVNTGYVTWSYIQNTSIGTPPQTTINHESISGDIKDILWAVSLPAVDPSSPNKAVIDLIARVGHPGYRIYYTVDADIPPNIIHGAVEHTFMWDIPPGTYNMIPAKPLSVGHDDWMPAPRGGLVTFEHVGINVLPTDKAVLNVGGGGLFHGPVFMQQANSEMISMESDTTQAYDFRITNISRNVTRLYIDDNGQLGIDTNAPENKLHVVGTTQITGKTSIGAGNAPWAKLHTQGETSDDTAYALRISNSEGKNLFSIRNDGLISTDPGEGGGGPGGGGIFIWEVDGSSVVLSTTTSGKHVNVGAGGLIVGANDLTPITSFGRAGSITHLPGGGGSVPALKVASTADWTDDQQIVSAKAINNLVQEAAASIWHVAADGAVKLNTTNNTRTVEFGSPGIRFTESIGNSGVIRSFGSAGATLGDPDKPDDDIKSPKFITVDWSNDNQIVSAKVIHDLFGEAGSESPWYTEGSYVKLTSGNTHKLVDLGTYGYRVGGEDDDLSPVMSFGRQRGAPTDKTTADPPDEEQPVTPSVNWNNDNQVVSAKAINAKFNSTTTTLEGLSDVTFHAPNDEIMSPDMILGWTGHYWSNQKSPEANSLSKIKADFTPYSLGIGKSPRVGGDSASLTIGGNIQLQSGPAIAAFENSPVDISDIRHIMSVPTFSALTPHFDKKANSNNGVTEWTDPGFKKGEDGKVLEISEGKGSIYLSYLGNPDFLPQTVSWGATTINLLTKLDTFGQKHVYIDQFGAANIQNEPLTNAQARQNIYLGYIVVENNKATTVVPAPMVAGTGGDTMEDYVRFQGDGLSLSGSLVAGEDVDGSRKIKISEGELFLPGVNYFSKPEDPNIDSTVGGVKRRTDSVLLTYITSKGAVSDTPDFNLPDTWEGPDALLQSLPRGKVAIHLIYQMPKGVVYMLYSQKTFNSVADAEKSLVDYQTTEVKTPEGLKGAVLLASAIVEGGETGIAVIHNRDSDSGGGVIPAPTTENIDDGPASPTKIWSSQKVQDDVQLWKRDGEGGITLSKYTDVTMDSFLTVGGEAYFETDLWVDGITELAGTVRMPYLATQTSLTKADTRTYLTSFGGDIRTLSVDDVKSDIGLASLKLRDLADVQAANTPIGGSTLVVTVDGTFQEQALSMKQLADVDMSTVDSGSILTYDSGKWVSADAGYHDPGDFDSEKDSLLSEDVPFMMISSLKTDTQGRIVSFQTSDLNTRYARTFAADTYDKYEKWNLFVDGGFGSSHFELGPNSNFKLSAGANMRFDIDEDTNELTLINTVQDTDTAVVSADFDIHSGILTLHNSDGGQVHANIDNRYSDKIHEHDLQYDNYKGWWATTGTDKFLVGPQKEFSFIGDETVSLETRRDADDNITIAITAPHTHKITELDDVKQGVAGDLMQWDSAGEVIAVPQDDIQSHKIKIAADDDSPGYLADKMLEGGGITIEENAGLLYFSGVEIDDSDSPAPGTVYSGTKTKEITATSSKGITYSWANETAKDAQEGFLKGEEGVVNDGPRPVYRATSDWSGTHSTTDWEHIYDMSPNLNDYLRVDAGGSTPGDVYSGNGNWGPVLYDNVVDKPDSFAVEVHTHGNSFDGGQLVHSTLIDDEVDKHREHSKIKIEAGGGLDGGTFSLTEGTHTIHHKTHPKSDIIPDQARVVNRVVMDGFGHATTFETLDITKYYNQPVNRDELGYIGKEGGTMDGDLTLNDGSFAMSDNQTEEKIKGTKLEELAGVEPPVADKFLQWTSSGGVTNVSKDDVNDGKVKTSIDDLFPGYLINKFEGIGINVSVDNDQVRLVNLITTKDGYPGVVYTMAEVDEKVSEASKGITYSWSTEADRIAEVGYTMGEEGILLQGNRPVFRATKDWASDTASIADWTMLYEMDSVSDAYVRKDTVAPTGTFYAGSNTWAEATWPDIADKPDTFKVDIHKHTTTDDGGLIVHSDLTDDEKDKHVDHTKVVLQMGDSLVNDTPGASSSDDITLKEGTFTIGHKSRAVPDTNNLRAEVLTNVTFDDSGHIASSDSKDLTKYYNEEALDDLDYLRLDGRRSMQGELLLSNTDPTNPMAAAPKTFVESKVAAIEPSDIMTPGETGDVLVWKVAADNSTTVQSVAQEVINDGKVRVTEGGISQYLGEAVEGDGILLSSDGDKLIFENTVKVVDSAGTMQSRSRVEVYSKGAVDSLTKAASQGIIYSWADEYEMSTQTDYTIGQEGIINKDSRPVYRATKNWVVGAITRDDWTHIYDMSSGSDEFLRKNIAGDPGQVYLGNEIFGNANWNDLDGKPVTMKPSEHHHTTIGDGGIIKHSDIQDDQIKKHVDHEKVSIKVGGGLEGKTFSIVEGTHEIKHAVGKISTTTPSDAKVIQSIAFDNYGHPTGVGKLDVTQYYTANSSKLPYLNKAGGTLTGNLTLGDGSLAMSAIETDTKISAIQLRDLDDVTQGTPGNIMTWGAVDAIDSFPASDLDKFYKVKSSISDAPGYLEDKIVMGEGIDIASVGGKLTITNKLKIDDDTSAGNTLYSSQKVAELTANASKGIVYSWVDEAERLNQRDYKEGEEGIVNSADRPVYKATTDDTGVSAPDDWQLMYSMDVSHSNYLQRADFGGPGEVYVGHGRFESVMWDTIAYKPTAFAVEDHDHISTGGPVDHDQLLNSLPAKHQDHEKIILNIGGGLKGGEIILTEGTHTISHTEATPIQLSPSGANVIQTFETNKFGHVTKAESTDLNAYYQANPGELPYLGVKGGTLRGDLHIGVHKIHTSTSSLASKADIDNIKITDIQDVGVGPTTSIVQWADGKLVSMPVEDFAIGKVSVGPRYVPDYLERVIDGTLEVDGNRLKVKTPLVIASDPSNPAPGEILTGTQVNEKIGASSQGIKYSWIDMAALSAQDNVIKGEQGVLNTGKRPVYRAKNDISFGDGSMSHWEILYYLDINADSYLLKTTAGNAGEVYVGGGQFNSISYAEIKNTPSALTALDHSHDGTPESGGQLSHSDLVSSSDQHVEHSKIKLEIGGGLDGGVFSLTEGTHRINHTVNPIPDTFYKDATVVQNVEFDGYGHVSGYESLDVTNYYNISNPDALDYLRLDGTKEMSGDLLLSNVASTNPRAAVPRVAMDEKVASIELEDLKNVNIVPQADTVLALDATGTSWTNRELDAGTIGALPDTTTLQIESDDGSLQVSESKSVRLADNKRWVINHSSHDFHMDVLPDNKVISKLTFDGRGHVVAIDTKDVGFGGVENHDNDRMITATTDPNKLMAHETLLYKRDSGINLTWLTDSLGGGIQLDRKTASGHWAGTGQSVGVVMAGGAGIEGKAAEPQAENSRGSHLHLLTTPRTSNLGVSRLSISADGAIEINALREHTSFTIFKPDMGGSEVAFMVGREGTVAVNTQEHTATFTVNGSISAKIRHSGEDGIFNSTYKVTEDDHTVLCGSGVTSVAFPTPDGRNKGRIIYVKTIIADVNLSCTASRAFFTTFEEDRVRMLKGKIKMLQSDGVHWQTLS